MSGHSKWSQIKHKKAATDKKRGQLFGKLARTIAIAARENPDPETNFRLRSAIENAQVLDMPSANIERVLRRVISHEQAELFDLIVEVIAPGNTALIITAVTDNGNRTMAELRMIAVRYDSRIADPGSLLWMFRKVGIIIVDFGSDDPESIGLRCIEAGADDIDVDTGSLSVLTDAIRFTEIQQKLLRQGVRIRSAYIGFTANTTTPPLDDSLSMLIRKMVEAFQENDDVENVFSNTAL